MAPKKAKPVVKKQPSTRKTKVAAPSRAAKTGSPQPASPYSVHPGVAMTQNWIVELKGKTGRTLEEWVQLIKRAGPNGDLERRRWLKSEFKLGANTAWLMVEHASDRQVWDEDAQTYLANAVRCVDDMFSGPKAALRPIYDRLLQIGLELGSDVRVCPCKTIVPLYRKHVFAQFKPSTLTRLDLGLALKDTPADDRLLDTGGRAKGDRLTHRIAVTSLDDIDDELLAWFRLAYDMNP